MTRRRRGSLWQAVLVAAGAAVAVAALGYSATDLGPWYQHLAKPSWQPPDWLFGPAWTVIYTLGAIAAVLGWRGASDYRRRGMVVGLFAMNALLNVLWSTLFFQFRRPDHALVEAVLLWLSVLLLIVVLRPSSGVAALLMVPYLAWVTFATVLNFSVVRLNGPFA
jgi:tryptophan-rich sensory protein